MNATVVPVSLVVIIFWAAYDFYRLQKAKPFEYAKDAADNTNSSLIFIRTTLVFFMASIKISGER